MFRWVFILFFLTACPTPVPEAEAPKIITFEALPATLPAGGGEVTLSWNVENADTLTIDSEIGIVTGTSKQVSVTTTTTFTLTANKGNKQTSATAIVTVAAETITGKVLTYDGKAGAFLPVLIANQKTATDASGNFSVSGVEVPYDLVVLQASKNQAYIYQGLRRLDPIILVLGSGNYDNETTVTFNSTNLDTITPLPAGGYADGHVACISTSGQQVSCGVTGSVFPAVDHNIRWTGNTGVSLKAYALQMHKNGSNVVTNFLRFGMAENIFLQDGQASNVNFSLEPVTNQAIAGTITAPVGYTLIGLAMGFKPSEHYLYPFSYELDNNGIANTFNWASPAITGMPLYLTRTAKKGESSVYTYLDDIAPNATGIELTIPEPPQQISPANNALGISTTTDFSWTPFTEGVHTFSLFTTTQGPLTMTIYTAASTLTLPDLSDLGYPLPKGTTYKWSIGGIAPFASIDDLADGVLYTFNLKSSGWSGERAFTTAP